MVEESFTVITSVVGVRLAFNSLRALIASTAYHPHTASSNNKSKGGGDRQQQQEQDRSSESTRP